MQHDALDQEASSSRFELLAQLGRGEFDRLGRRLRRRVKPFSEPAVDRSQQFASLLRLALVTAFASFRSRVRTAPASVRTNGPLVSGRLSEGLVDAFPDRLGGFGCNLLSQRRQFLRLFRQPPEACEAHCGGDSLDRCRVAMLAEMPGLWAFLGATGVIFK